MGFKLNAYALRHSFATDKIIEGVDLVTIATLMGHRDLKMLQKHYQNVKYRPDHLREALRKQA
jgi:site-specific recombinase XerD